MAQSSAKTPVDETLQKFKNMSIEPPGQTQFLTRTIPDIPRDAYIIGVCGIADDPRGESFTSPSLDGWFLSDFFAFNYLLNGVGSGQKWFATRDERSLVGEWGEYLHGNPFYDRKVVLNRRLIEAGKITPVIAIPDHQLADTFMASLTAVCKKARAEEKPVLAFVFGHGDDESFGIRLGSEENGKDILPEQVERLMEPGVNLTIFTNACFSGGWSVRKSLNCSMATAANHRNPSESWTRSASGAERHCGGVWASAIIATLTEASSPLVAQETGPTSDTTSIKSSGGESVLSLQPQDATPEQTKTYHNFAQTVKRSLMEQDRWWHTTGLTFAAQDDDWERAWSSRTGIPLINFAERWNSLETKVSTMDATQSLNRDSSVQVGGTRQPQSLTASLSRTGSIGTRSTQQLVRQLKLQTKQQLRCFPHSWQTAQGHYDYDFFDDFIKNDSPSHNEIYSVIMRLAYRTSVVKFIEGLLKATGVPSPQQIPCRHFNFGIWSHEYRDRHGFRADERIDKTYRKLVTSHILPKPTKEQSGYRSWSIANWYITAAFVEAGLSDAEVDSKLTQMLAIREDRIARAQLDMVEEPVVRTTAGLWLSSVGRSLLELPQRRRSTRSHGRSKSGVPSASGSASGSGIQTPTNRSRGNSLRSAAGGVISGAIERLSPKKK
ncbi:hypothetical protein ACHAQA_001855 [Verticillium albo-atrum]